MTEPTFLIRSPLLPLIFLIGGAILTAFNACIILLGRFKALEELKKIRVFSFRNLMIRFFPKHEWENLNFMLSFTNHLVHLLYAGCAFFYVLSLFNPNRHPFTEDLLTLILIVFLLIVFSIFLDFIFRLIAAAWTKTVLKIFSPFTSLFLFIFFPLSGLLLKIIRVFFRVTSKEKPYGQAIMIKDRLKDMIRDSELSNYLDSFEQKLISSVITFRDRVAKEIMIPRIDMISLSCKNTVKDAAKLFLQERYSRIPIYKDTLDNIIGVLLYKDILKLFMESQVKKETPDPLDTPVETMSKPVIYTPENKKITQLLQEFRTKQIHLAIVVDEYGGTEGIVTIEDILEELVGEIEDEYDSDEIRLYWKLPNGSWIVDAKMSIIDIESKLGIHIPPHPEYETIGGYVFHRAGTIPLKGWTIQHDEFELEVLSSNDRSIEKIRITPRTDVDNGIS